MIRIFQPTPQSLSEIECRERDIQKQIDALIELKCKELTKGTSNSKGNAFHLEQWMKGYICNEVETPEEEREGSVEEWTQEMLRKRSEELQLIDAEGNVKTKEIKEVKKNENGFEEVLSDLDHSPSKSTTTESQVSRIV